MLCRKWNPEILLLIINHLKAISKIKISLFGKQIIYIVYGLLPDNLFGDWIFFSFSWSFSAFSSYGVYSSLWLSSRQ